MQLLRRPYRPRPSLLLLRFSACGVRPVRLRTPPARDICGIVGALGPAAPSHRRCVGSRPIVGSIGIFARFLLQAPPASSFTRIAVSRIAKSLPCRLRRFVTRRTVSSGRRAAPRVSLAGSRFDGGCQRFEVQDGRADRVFLVEGPLSALAAPAVFPELISEGWTVVGVAGWAGFRRAAVGSARIVRVCPDGDADGQRAVARFVEDLVASGLRVLVDQVPPGADLLDLHRWGGSTVRPLPVVSGPPYPFLLTTATPHVQTH